MVEQYAYVFSVPAEIWAEVFLHAQKESLIEGTYDQARFTHRDIPISVSQVCDRFRRIAINTPPLWTSIVVNFSLSSNPSFTLSMTRSWLDRSKNYPLNLFVYNIYVSELVGQRDKSECFRTLLLHIGRWKKVTLNWRMDTDNNFWSSLRVPSASAPLLESLVLRPIVYRKVTTTKTLLPSLILANSPFLTKLVVSLHLGVNIGDGPSNGNPIFSWNILESHTIPYQQLTRLHFDANTDEVIPCAKVLEIFRRAPSLVCCFIKGVEATVLQNISEFSTQVLLLKALRHLYLETHDITSVSCFLNYIIAPSLLSLTLAFQHTRAFDVNSLERFVNRSSCALEEFNLIGPAMSDSVIHSCLMATSSSLRRLHVGCMYTVYANNIVIESTTSWDPSSSTPGHQRCPQLDQISFSSDWRDPDYRRWETYMIHLMLKVVSWCRENPQSGSQTLKSVLIPSHWDRPIPPQLVALRGDPWNIDTLGFNDNLYKSEALWKRFADE